MYEYKISKHREYDVLELYGRTDAEINRIGVIYYKKDAKTGTINTEATYAEPEFRKKKIGTLMRRHLLLRHIHEGYRKVSGDSFVPRMEHNIGLLNKKPPEYSFKEGGKTLKIPMLKLAEGDIPTETLRINGELISKISKRRADAIIRNELRMLGMGRMKKLEMGIRIAKGKAKRFLKEI